MMSSSPGGHHEHSRRTLGDVLEWQHGQTSMSGPALSFHFPLPASCELGHESQPAGEQT